MKLKVLIASLVAAFSCAVFAANSSSSAAPEIVSAHWRTIRIKVPDGFESVTLQRRSARRGHAWETLEVKRCDKGTSEVKFRLKKRLPKRMLRVLGTKVGEMPAQFLTGRTEFQSPEGANSTIPLGTGVPRAGGLALAAGANDDAGGVVAERSVVESDVWKLSGDRLYLFNQYRGLQVLDVADPAQPAILGTLPFPAAGEDLYDLGNGRIALLANTQYLLGWNVAEPGGAEGSLVICNASEGTPKVIATFPIAGRVLASRLVGTALYVASEVTDTRNDGWAYRMNIQVTGFDLGDPDHPVVRNTVTLRTARDDSYAWFGAVQASSDYFLVAENTYRWDIGDTRSTVTLVDISNPNGTVALRGRVALNGFVQDKFKLREDGGRLTAISAYLAWGNGRRQSFTQLDNFDVSNPDRPEPLGGLRLGLGEQVHGTRFDGDRVYVVTFFQIDPLWIVDNSDPANPVIASELEVPGFSTYLAPLGDRLVTVGFLNGQVAVSLFDVADAENPALLTQLPVTEPGAWSEANWDEKAFTVLPDEGLIMLPASAGWRWWWGGDATPDFSGVQIVDLGRDALTLRGRIPHGFAPRRATVHAGSVLAFSQDSLLTADITDRDAPVVTNDLQLAWRTDRVWHVGKHLLQVGGAIGGKETLISVSPADAPDDTISSLNLGPDALVATDVRNDYLYVIQQEIVPPGVETLVPPSATLSIFDLTSLPRIVSKGTLRTSDLTIETTWSGKIVWPQDGTLVLAHGNTGGYWRGGPIYLDHAPLGFARSFAVDGVSLPWYFPRASEKHFEEFDVSTADAPVYVGRNTIKTKGWGQFSSPVAGGGRVFITRWAAPLVVHPIPIGILATAEGDAEDSEEPEIVPDEDPFVGRYALHVLDYSAPGGTKVSPPISAPGELIGLRDNGRVLYTRGYGYDSIGRGIAGSAVIHASAFDGARLHLIDTLPTDGGEALPVEDKLFALGWKRSRGIDGEFANFAALWRLEDAGTFHLLDEEKFDGHGLRAFGSVLFAQTYLGYGSGLAALDFSNPGDMKRIGTYRLPGWLWADLANADGNPADGIWVPFGNHGVLKVELPAGPR